MFTIVLLSVVLGLASASPQGFPQETAANIAARNEFIREYNRLAALAAAAPDIHMYTADRRIDNPNLNVISHHRRTPAVHHKPAFVAPVFNSFAFTAHLGANKQFIPQANTFPATPRHHTFPAAAPRHHTPAVAPRHHTPAVKTVQHQGHHLGGHLAGHLAGHQAGHHFRPQPVAGPIKKWNGPFADTIPAGVNGLPQQVQDTPEVAAAKAAHYAALNAAYQAAPRTTRF